MRLFLFVLLLLSLHPSVTGQSLLGKTKKEILALHNDCTALNNYQIAVVFNCSGSKSIYYFNGKDSTCDLYARDIYANQAKDTLQFLLGKGFKKSETRYVEPFLVSRKSDHQKFPSQVYTDGIIQYCFMPVSMNGKTAESNTIIVMYPAKKK